MNNSLQTAAVNNMARRIVSSCSALGELSMDEVRRLAAVADVSNEVNRDDKVALCRVLATKFEVDRFDTVVDTIPGELRDPITGDPMVRWPVIDPAAGNKQYEWDTIRLRRPRWKGGSGYDGDFHRRVQSKVRALGLWTPAISVMASSPKITFLALTYDPGHLHKLPSWTSWQDELDKNDSNSRHLTFRTQQEFLLTVGTLHINYPNLGGLSLISDKEPLLFDANTVRLPSRLGHLFMLNMSLQNSDKLIFPSTLHRVVMKMSRRDTNYKAVNVANWAVPTLLLDNVRIVNGRISNAVTDLTLMYPKIALRDIHWPNHLDKLELWARKWWRPEEQPNWPDTIREINLEGGLNTQDSIYWKRLRWPAQLESLVVRGVEVDLQEIEQFTHRDRDTEEELTVRRAAAMRLFQERAATQDSERGRRVRRRGIQREQAEDAAAEAAAAANRPQCQNVESYITLMPFEKDDDVVTLLLPHQQDDSGGGVGRRRAREASQLPGVCYTRGNLLAALSRQWVKVGGRNALFFRTPGPGRELLNEETVELIRSSPNDTVFQLVIVAHDESSQGMNQPLYAGSVSSWDGRD